jgi:Rod binding domain-containing protein
MISPVESGASTRTQVASFSTEARDLKKLSGPDQVAAAAGQFEAILMRQFLQESVGKIMGGHDGGSQGGVYGYMLTDVLASKLAEGGGLGLSRMLQQQLSPNQTASLAPRKSS